ncbi:MAG: hypothetical protein ABIX01_20365 [Chitinophagaceae bacterium]
MKKSSPLTRIHWAGRLKERLRKGMECSCKPLANGDYAIGVVNCRDTPQMTKINFSDLGLADKYGIIHLCGGYCYQGILGHFSMEFAITRKRNQSEDLVYKVKSHNYGRISKDSFYSTGSAKFTKKTIFYTIDSESKLAHSPGKISFDPIPD